MAIYSTLAVTALARPRRYEKEFFGKLSPPVYDYGKEGEASFHVKRKKFFDLDEITYLMKVYCKNLPHESDGLIFQVESQAFVGGAVGDDDGDDDDHCIGCALFHALFNPEASGLQ